MPPFASLIVSLIFISSQISIATSQEEDGASSTDASAISADGPNITIGEFKDGGCLPERDPIDFDFSWVVRFMGQYRYTPMASNLHFFMAHTNMKGGGIKDASELKKICLRTKPGIVTIAKGYGNLEFRLSCEIAGAAGLNCNNVKNSALSTSLTLAWTDNNKYLLFTTCDIKKYKAWTLMSTVPTLDKITRDKVIKIIKKFGFDENKVTDIDYSTCPKDKTIDKN